MNENSSRITEIFNLFSPLLTTCLSLLSSLSLINHPSSNARIIALLLLEFITHTSGDYDVSGAAEIVERCDAVGLDLKMEGLGIKGLEITDEEIEGLREEDRDDLDMREWKEVFTQAWKRDHPGGKHYVIEKMSKKQKKQSTY